MGAGAAAWAAAERPHAVSGLALIGPFVRNTPMNPLLVAAFRIAMSGPWARPVWIRYLPSLYAGDRPEDLAEHLAEVDTSLAAPGTPPRSSGPPARATPPSRHGWTR